MSSVPGNEWTRWSAGLRATSRAAFDWWQRIAAGRPATASMFAWAFAEATAWPVIPDFLLVLLVAGNRRRFHQPLAAAILGSALGGAAILLFAYWAPDHARNYLTGLPLVHEPDIAHVARELEERGVRALFLQPWSGIAFKIWGVTAGAQGLSPWLVIPSFIVARALRMTVLALLVRGLVGRFAAFFRDRSLLLFGLYVVVFCYWWWRTQVLT